MELSNHDIRQQLRTLNENNERLMGAVAALSGIIAHLAEVGTIDAEKAAIVGKAIVGLPGYLAPTVSAKVASQTIAVAKAIQSPQGWEVAPESELV